MKTLDFSRLFKIMIYAYSVSISNFFISFAEISMHCVLSGGTQRRILPLYRSEEMKILNN